MHPCHLSQVLHLALQSWGCKVCDVQSEDEAIRELIDAGSLDLESTLHASGMLLDSGMEEMEIYSKIHGQQGSFQSEGPSWEISLRSQSITSSSQGRGPRCRGEVANLAARPALGWSE